MKRLFLFTMMCLFGLFSSLSAQTTVDLVIGSEGTTASAQVPNYEYYNYSISQQIYTVDEMQQLEGTITSIAFKQYDATARTRTLAIYLLNTDKGSFDSTTDWVSVPSENLVWAGTVDYPAVAGEWMEFQLQTPFEYEGGNLLVCVCDNTGSWKSTASFYTYNAGTAMRALYAYRDGSSYNTADPNVSGYFSMDYGTGNSRNNVVRFGITVSGEFKSLKVTPKEIALGDRPNGAWMRPVNVTIGTRGSNLDITSVEPTNSFFKLSENELPTTVTNKNPLVYEVTHGEADGQINGQLAIAYGETRELEMVDMTAFAYTPGAADVWETATAITSYPFTATPDMATTYDNYLLPGEAQDGKDVVYEMNFNNDVVLSANVEGADGKVAVYAADFAGAEGPMVDNNYNGPEVGYAPIPAASNFYFDFEGANIDGFKAIDANNDGYTWESSYYYLGSWGYSHNSYFCATSVSSMYGLPMDPDDYLATEEKYSIFPESELSFWVSTVAMYPSEHYGVAVSTDGENFTTIFDETFEFNGNTTEEGMSEWKKVTVSLADYAGQEVYLAIRHFNSADNYILFVDDVKLSRYGDRRSSAISNLVLPAGKYYIAASSTADFTVNVNAETIPAPEKPNAPVPANTAQNITDPSLSWTFGANTVEYQLLFGTAYPPKDVYVDWTNNLEIGHVIRDLYNNKNYFWQVNVRNSSGTTYGDIWSFTTTFNIPTNIQLDKADIYEGESATISWEAVKDRSYRGYNVYVNGQKHNKSIVTELSYTLEDLPYNMNGHQVNVTAVYDEGESSFSESVAVYVTGMSSVAGHLYEQDGVTPLSGGVVVLNGTDELGNAAAYTFNADETGAFSGEILAGNYIATASVELYQNTEVEFTAAYGVTSEVNISMYEVYNPVKYITATEVEDRVEVVWGMQRYGSGFEDFETGDFSLYPWNNEVSDFPFAITENAYEGDYAMKSTCEGNDYGVSAIELTVDVPMNGVVGFNYRISCEAVYDYATFYIDGEAKATMTGISDWAYKEVSVTEGTHTYRWEYTKDVMWEDGEDAFYVDNITFYKEPTPFEGGWLHYDDGTFASSIGLGEPAPMYWGIKYPETASYAGYTISKVAIYDTPADYAGGTGTYTANIYLGGDAAPGSLVATQDVNLTGTGDFVEIELSTPVALDGTQALWITFYTSTIPFPAGGCAYVGDSNSDLLSLDGATWEHAADYDLSYSWMIRAYLDNAKGQTAVLTRASDKKEFKGGVSTGTFVANVASEPIYVGVPSTESAAAGNRAFASYNFYKKNIYGAEELLMSKTTDTSYIDNSWATAEAGVYQWGVSALYEGNRGSEYLLTEDFEGGAIPTGWSRTHNFTYADYYGVPFEWYVGEIIDTGYDFDYSAGDGKFSAFSNHGDYFWDYVTAGYLVTPMINLQPKSMLEFLYTNPRTVSYISRLTVCVSESPEGPWTEVWTTTESTTQNVDEWRTAEVSLDGYVGNYYIAFGHMMDQSSWYGGYAVGIDNVAVSFEAPESPILWSKPIDKDMSTTVTVSAMTDNGDPVSGTNVTFTNVVEEGVVYTAALNAEGTVTFDNFRKGTYELTVAKDGFLSSIEGEVVEIWEASQFNAFLTENLATVEGLYVSPTGWAMWEGKMVAGNGSEFAYSFDEGLEGWTTIDGNGDGHVWYHSSESEMSHAVLPGDAHSGAGCLYSESYCNALGALFPDDYIVSPERVAIGGSSVLKFYACTKDDGYPSEHFGVALSAAGNTSASDFTTIAEWTMTGKGEAKAARGRGEQGTWYEYEVDLSEYAGQEAYIALRHFNTTDMFILMVDDLSLTNDAKSDRALLGYTVLLDGVVEAENLPVNYYQHENVSDGFQYTTTVIASYTMGDSEEMEYTWTKVSEDIFAGVKDLAAEYKNESVELTWALPEAPEEPVEPEVIMSWNFDDSAEGWTTIDANNDNHVWYHSSQDEAHGVSFNDYEAHNGTGVMMSESYCNFTNTAIAVDDYLVSPEMIPVTESTIFSFWACSKDYEWPNEHFGVAVSTTGNTSAADFTTISEWTIAGKCQTAKEAKRGTRDITAWTKYTVDLSAYAGQNIWVAIRHFNCSDMFILMVDDVEVLAGTGGNDNNESDLAFGFESGLDGWTTIDGNGDGHVWYHSSESEAYHSVLPSEPHTGSGYVGSESYCNYYGALNPDDYLVSPEKYAVSNGAKITFWACTKDDGYPSEVFGVAVSTAGNTSTSDFTTISQWTMTGKSSKGTQARGRGEQGTWYQYEADLSEYAGQEIYVALRHFNCTDMFILMVDDVEISLGSKSRDSREGTWAYYDNGVNEDAIGGPQSFSWGIKLRAADIANLGALTKVAAFDRVATSGTFDICLGGDNEPGASVLNQAYTWTGINDFVEIELTEAIDPQGQNVWIVFNTDDGTNYPAAECSDTGDADGRWIYLASDGWFDVTEAGIPCTWMLRGYFDTDAAGGGDDDDDEEGIAPIAEILGVMIYRNGELMSSKLVSGTSYTDNKGQIGDEYCVKVVYGGEADSTYYAMSNANCAEADFTIACEAPKDLYGVETSANEVTLTLSYNPNPVGEWLYYDNGVNEDGIGGPAEFSWGIMFPAESLAAYEGTSFTKVSLFDFAMSSGNINIHYGGTSAPGDLVHSQAYTGTGVGDFVEFDLTAALPIDPTMNVWVIFTTTQGTSYPASCCANTGDANGRWISTDGVTWEDITAYGLNNTWMIRAYATNAKGEVAQLGTITDYEYPSSEGELKSAGVRASSALSHYNVYRGTTASNMSKVGETTSKTYVEEVSTGTYYYQMTAVYEEYGEECESAPANAYGSDEEYVVVAVTSIDENGVKGMMVYPNPTKDNLSIEAEGMTRITITNALGQVMYDQEVVKDSEVINMGQYEAGVYMVRISTETGVAIERITVIK